MIGWKREGRMRKKMILLVKMKVMRLGGLRNFRMHGRGLVGGKKEAMAIKRSMKKLTVCKLVVVLVVWCWHRELLHRTMFLRLGDKMLLHGLLSRPCVTLLLPTQLKLL